jgi:5-methylcytosine-specific restriction endonuclease McrA
LAEQKGLKPDELDWSYWQMDNLQTLCYKCHKEKSGKELKNKFKMIREKKSKVQIKKLKTFL